MLVVIVIYTAMDFKLCHMPTISVLANVLSVHILHSRHSDLDKSLFLENCKSGKFIKKHSIKQEDEATRKHEIGKTVSAHFFLIPLKENLYIHQISLILHTFFLITSPSSSTK